MFSDCQQDLYASQKAEHLCWPRPADWLCRSDLSLFKIMLIHCLHPLTALSRCREK